MGGHTQPVDPAVTRTLAQIIKGGSTLFGVRIALAWPNGMPDWMDETRLQVIAERWLRATTEYPPNRIPVDKPLCEQPEPCFLPIENGQCTIHKESWRRQ